MHASRLELLDLADPDVATSTASQPIGDAIRSPILTLRLFVERLGFRVVHDGWVDAHTAVLHPDLEPTESAPVAFGSRATLPSLIAGCCGLSVRTPPSPRRALVDRSDIAAALTEGEPIPGLGPLATVWTLNARSVGGAEAAFTVLDQGSDNAVWLVQDASDMERLLIEDVGAVGIWQELGKLLGMGVAVDPTRPDPPLDDGDTVTGDASAAMSLTGRVSEQPGDSSEVPVSTA